MLCYQNIYLAQHQKGADRKGSGNLPGVGKDIKRERLDDKYRPKEMSQTRRRAMVVVLSQPVLFATSTRTL